MTRRPLLIDPVLPSDFDNTPNEERSKEDLDQWWDQPFAVSRVDGSFEVRCLDGGCWDRSTSYGLAKDLIAASMLAETKLAQWQKIRAEPVAALTGSGCQVMRMPQRPDEDSVVLEECATLAEAQIFIEGLKL
ncbi:MAG: hypothetical protein Q7U28_09270 [Aquabacterium sp.]|nr:hypothetical protein [Aquabacterium sp.]